jgi:hypothetical protein
VENKQDLVVILTLPAHPRDGSAKGSHALYLLLLW